MKKVIAFDLDDTLAITKSPIDDRMAVLLTQLLDHFDVCVISGGAFPQFKKQIIDRLIATPRQLARMHLMPTCGTRYYRYDEVTEEWAQQYAEDLTSAQKKAIIAALESGAKQLGYWEANPAGDIIEDRGSQVTYSAVGQQATPEAKYAWDPSGVKKRKLQKLVADMLPDLEVRAGGSTSIDVTRIGIDKAYGITKLIEALTIDKNEVLFFGDRLEPGGNDYPVKAMGVDTVEVTRWTDTALALEAILHVI
ncbi:MAG: family hydrolase [Candidatus Saccharibacteria bacterium]|nr:family hydrolase [Candidatus Saccharibacteria bacterium]